MASVEVALDCHAELGESPVCTPDGVVHFVDISGRQIHRFDTATRAHEKLSTGARRPGCVVPYTGDSGVGLQSSGGYSLLAAFEDSLLAADVGSACLSDTQVFSFPEGHTAPSLRSNDGKVDPGGRFWFGTFNTQIFDDKNCQPKGRLYCLKKAAGALNLGEKLNDVGVSNGLAWDADHMFFIDSSRQCVDAFSYDASSGDIGNRKTAVRISSDKGMPDGMTIDAAGKLWVALWRGSAVVQYDRETGRQLQEISLPAKFITSLAFGGKHLDELYVTSSGVPDDGSMPDTSSPYTGGLFRLRIPGVQGRSYADSFSF